MSPTEPEPLTLAEVVRRAVEICDAGARSRDVQDLLARLEDADEPITAVRPRRRRSIPTSPIRP